MPELDDDERAYLSAFREVHTPSDAVIQSRLAQVQERLAAGAVVALPDDDAAPAEPSRARPLVVLGIAAVAIAAAVVLMMRLDVTTMLAGEAGHDPQGAAYAGQDSGEVEGEAVARTPARRTSRGGGSKATPSEEPAAEEPVVEEPVVEEPAAEEPAAEEPAAEPARRRRPRSPERSPEEPAADDGPAPAPDATLHAEIALLRPAQKALRSGNYAQALRLLDDHAKSFPRSVLAEERSLGRIKALCGLDRRDEAQRMIQKFGKTHPGSPLAGRVKKACPAEDSP